MFNLIPVLLFIGALGGILYIVSNHLSELNSEDEENDFREFNFKSRFAEYANRLPLDTIKRQSLAITKKTLHRVRLALLKTDNHLIKLIGKISQGDKAVNVKTNENDSIPDFWEKIADSSEDFVIKNKSEEKISVPTVEPELKISFVNKPVKIYSEISEVPIIKKTLKKKKYSK